MLCETKGKICFVFRGAFPAATLLIYFINYTRVYNIFLNRVSTLVYKCVFTYCHIHRKLIRSSVYRVNNYFVSLKLVKYKSYMFIHNNIHCEHGY